MCANPCKVGRFSTILGDEHYDTISAFIKSVRGSDPDAALLWLAKMLAAGEDPRFIARRLVILAAEDVGNADPQGLQMATAALHAVQAIGMPEARIVLSQVTTYLACAPKSNAAYVAINKALADVESGIRLQVPPHLRGTGYSGAKELGEWCRIHLSSRPPRGRQGTKLLAIGHGAASVLCTDGVR